MRFLRTNTAVRLTVGPFFDKTDGVTPETSITVTSCKLTLMVDDANVPTLVLDTAPTASGGANDMVHVTGDDAGFYDLELAAGNVNYLGRAMLAITDAATHCPVFHEFMLLPAMIYDAMVLGSDRLDTNTTHINDVAASSVTTIAAVLGTTSAPTITSGRVNADVTHIATAAVSTSTAQLGVNVVNNAGSAITSAAGIQEVKVASIAANAITATAINADAITDAKVASDVTIASVTGAVGSVTGAVGSVTGNVGGNVTGSVGSVATGGITTASFAAGAINAAAIGADAITDAKVASDVTIASVTGAVGSVTGAVGSVTGNVGGNVTGSVGSVVGDIGGLAAGAITDVEDAVWDATLTSHLDSGTTGAALNSAGSAGDPWGTALPGAYGSGSAGHIVGTALPDIAPGSANALLRAGTNAATSITTALTANVIGNVTGNLSGSVGSVTGAVGSVTGAVGSVTGNVGGNVTGNVTGTIGGLTTAAKAEVQQEAEDALAVVGVTTTVTGRIDAAVSTRASQTSVDDLPTNAELATSQAAADDATLAAIAALNNLSSATVLTQMNTALDSTIADSVPADGTRPSVRSALYMLTQFMLEREVIGTTLTVKKADGSTTLLTLTLDDATTPTAITRTT